MQEAEAQHGLAKQLLRQMENQYGSEFENNFQALIANVLLHIEQEQKNVFPGARRLGDRLGLRELGQELALQKKKANGSETDNQRTNAGKSARSSLREMTVDELYQRARDLDVHYRSNMNKEELVEAIQGKGDDLSSLSKNDLTRKARDLYIHAGVL